MNYSVPTHNITPRIEIVCLNHADNYTCGDEREIATTNTHIDQASIKIYDAAHIDMSEYSHTLTCVYDTFSKHTAQILKSNKLINNDMLFDLIELIHAYNLRQYMHSKYHTCYVSESSETCHALANILGFSITNNMTTIPKPDTYECEVQPYTYTFKCMYMYLDCTHDNRLSHNSAENTCTRHMIRALLTIMQMQLSNGAAVIKVSNTSSPAVIDCIFILCYLYEHVYITRPTITNPMTNVRYIVCVNMTKDAAPLYTDLLCQFNAAARARAVNLCITQIISNNIPCHVLNRIVESNTVIGQQQLESLDQLTNVVTNKNKQDKLHVFNKAKLIKCANWVKKYNM